MPNNQDQQMRIRVSAQGVREIKSQFAEINAVAKNLTSTLERLGAAFDNISRGGQRRHGPTAGGGSSPLTGAIPQSGGGGGLAQPLKEATQAFKAFEVASRDSMRGAVRNLRNDGSELQKQIDNITQAIQKLNATRKQLTTDEERNKDSVRVRELIDYRKDLRRQLAETYEQRQEAEALNERLGYDKETFRERASRYAGIAGKGLGVAGSVAQLASTGASMYQQYKTLPDQMLAPQMAFQQRQFMGALRGDLRDAWLMKYGKGPNGEAFSKYLQSQYGGTGAPNMMLWGGGLGKMALGVGGMITAGAGLLGSPLTAGTSGVGGMLLGGASVGLLTSGAQDIMRAAAGGSKAMEAQTKLAGMDAYWQQNPMAREAFNQLQSEMGMRIEGSRAMQQMGGIKAYNALANMAGFAGSTVQERVQLASEYGRRFGGTDMFDMYGTGTEGPLERILRLRDSGMSMGVAMNTVGTLTDLMGGSGGGRFSADVRESRKNTLGRLGQSMLGGGLATVNSDVDDYRKRPRGRSGVHGGVDFAASAGQKFFAAEDGKIEKIGFDQDGNPMISVRNMDNSLSEYFHTIAAEGLQEGMEIRNTGFGDMPLGTIAPAMGTAKGAHLHYQKRGADGQLLDVANNMVLKESLKRATVRSGAAEDVINLGRGLISGGSGTMNSGVNDMFGNMLTQAVMATGASSFDRMAPIASFLGQGIRAGLGVAEEATPYQANLFGSALSGMAGIGREGSFAQLRTLRALGATGGNTRATDTILRLMGSEQGITELMTGSDVLTRLGVGAGTGRSLIGREIGTQMMQKYGSSFDSSIQEAMRRSGGDIFGAYAGFGDKEGFAADVASSFGMNKAEAKKMLDGMSGQANLTPQKMQEEIQKAAQLATMSTEGGDQAGKGALKVSEDVRTFVSQTLEKIAPDIARITAKELIEGMKKEQGKIIKPGEVLKVTVVQ